MPVHVDHIAATDPAAPTPDDILRIWSAERRLGARTMIVYLNRIQQFRNYCDLHGLVEREELTLERVGCFIDWYAERRGLDPRSLRLSSTALLSLSRVYHRLGLAPPDWRPPRPVKALLTLLLAQYAAYLTQHRGNPEVTVHKKLGHIGRLQDHLIQAGKDWYSMQLTDVEVLRH